MTTAEDTVEGAEFEFRSNRHYLFRELGRLKQRLLAYNRAKEDHAAIEDYYQLAIQMLTSRTRLMEARHSAVKSGISIPLDTLSRRLGLNPVEEETLMICLGPHLSTSILKLLIAAQGSILKQYLEVGFVAELAQPSPHLLTSIEWCRPNARLIASNVLEVGPPEGTEPMTSLGEAVRAPGYLASYAEDRLSVDPRLAPFCELIEPTVELFDVIVPERTAQNIQTFISNFKVHRGHLDLGDTSWTLLIFGPRRSGKTELAMGLARAFRRPLLAVDFPKAAKLNKLPKLIELAGKNAQFLGAVLLLNQPERLLQADPTLLGHVTSLLSSYRGLAILEPFRADELDDSFEALVDFPIEIEHGYAEDRLQLWESLLPDDARLAPDVDLLKISSTFGLTGGQIQAAIQWALQIVAARGSTSQLTQADLLTGAKSQVRSKLKSFTDKSSVKLTLSDLILPEDTMSHILEFVGACREHSRVMHEWGFSKRLVTGRGLVTLFTGEPGTGKTLCAEILANELDLELHIVSIPKVVSKWVGETEKNIREIFTHARAQNSMLLFDEADALFAKRVKVEKSQDQFQNMEVNMLLTEIERFDGIVILTTNLEANIDRAFERRILYRIDFPNPAQPEREAIWRTLIPKSVPLAPDVDFDFLSTDFELTGGQIKNAIIRAAYACASARSELTFDSLEHAARQAAKAAGQLIRPDDVDW